jgi:hypothetical protein
VTSAAPSGHWLGRVLQVLPAGVLARLDAWSARVAQRRAQQRLQARRNAVKRAV